MRQTLRLPKLALNRVRVPLQILRRGHEGVYSELFYNTYRQVSTFNGMINERTFDMILDVGCGYGRMTPWIMDYSKNYYAIDPSNRYLKLAQYYYQDATFVEATAEDLPFVDSNFDLVVAWNSLMYVHPDSFVRALKEINRVLKTDATLIIRVDVGGGEKIGERWVYPIGEYVTVLNSLILEEKVKLMDRTQQRPYEAMVFRFESQS